MNKLIIFLILSSVILYGCQVSEPEEVQEIEIGIGEEPDGRDVGSDASEAESDVLEVIAMPLDTESDVVPGASGQGSSGSGTSGGDSGSSEQGSSEPEPSSLSDLQEAVCNAAHDAGTCDSRLGEIGIVLKTECCEALGKCC